MDLLSYLSGWVSGWFVLVIVAVVRLRKNSKGLVNSTELVKESVTTVVKGPENVNEIKHS